MSRTLICSRVWRSSLVLALVATAAMRAAADETFTDLPALVWWANAAASRKYELANHTGRVTAGDPVGFLADLSGRGHHAVMDDSVLAGGNAFRPTFVADVVRGKPALLFDGGSILSLQHNLIDGAADATLVFAIAGANAFQGNRRVWGAWNGDRVAAVGFSPSAQPTVSLGLSGGARLTANDSSSFNFGGLTGSDTVEILIARFQAGGALELFGNGRLRATSAAANLGAAINSPQIKLLGNQNALDATGVIRPARGEGGKFYFLEGLATRSYLSDDQVSSVYRQLTQRWQGVQVLEQSPNLQWNAATNRDRTTPVPDAGHLQGIAVDAGGRYVFHTRMIERYDAHWSRETGNIDVFNGIPRTHGEPGHVGDGAVYRGKVYAPIETVQTGEFFAVYDATAAGLPLVAARDVTLDGQPRFSALTIVPEHGAHGVIYAPAYSTTGPSKLYRFDLQNGDTASPSFCRPLGAIDLPPSLLGIQGIAWQAPYFYFSVPLGPGGNRIDRIRWTGDALDRDVQNALHAYTTVQGLDLFDGLGYQALQSGSGSESIFTLENLDFTSLGISSQAVSLDPANVRPPLPPLVLVPEPTGLALAAAALVFFALLLSPCGRRRARGCAAPQLSG